MRQLNELAPSLKMLGWDVNTGARSYTTRKIIISSVHSVRSEEETDGDGDAACAANAFPASFSSLKETLGNVRQWILDNKDGDSQIDLNDLTAYVKSLGEDEPSKIIEVLRKDGLVFEVSSVGKLGVG